MTATEVIRTYLELTDPGELRPAPPPRTNGDVEIARVDPPQGATSRWFYEHVGRDHAWTDNLGRTAAEWQAWADGVETWVATIDAEHAGYYELRAGPARASRSPTSASSPTPRAAASAGTSSRTP